MEKNNAEEDVDTMNRLPHLWNTALEPEFAMPLSPAALEPAALTIAMHTPSAAMTFLTLDLIDAKAGSGYRTQIVLEWSGLHDLVVPLQRFEAYGEPSSPPYAAVRMTLTVADRGSLEPALSLGDPRWEAALPPIVVNEGERLLDVFTHPGFWAEDSWKRASGDGQLDKKWLYGQLSVRSGEGRPGFVSFRKTYDRAIDDYQAIVLGVSTDELGAFSLTLSVDGAERRAIDAKPGCGFEELRAELGGSVLDWIELELSLPGASPTDAAERHAVSLVYWIMLELQGADPSLANEVYGAPDIAPPLAEMLAAASDEALLPVGFLFDRDELLRLRRRVREGVPAQLFRDIRAEAEANLGYRPETYAGTYMPVDWARQGIERASSPNDKTRKLFSTLVYSALVYAVDGDLRFGLAARRALLTVARIKHWAAGFVARIPVGLRGYRATFIESHTSQAAALCYDLICPLLSEEERREVEDALYEKGVLWIDAFLRQNGEGYLLISNQGAVFTMGLLYAAHAAKRRHPEAAAIAERWSQWLLRMLAGYYKEDGSTNEGMMYWEYTTHYAVESLLLISRFSGRPVSELVPPSMAKTLDYIAHTRSLAYPSLRFLPLGDCRNEDFQFMGPSLLFFARALGDARGDRLWKENYAKAHPPGSPFFGVPIGTGQYTTNGLLTLLLGGDGGRETPELPPVKLFPETERLFWRTGMSYGDKLMFFEGGPQSFEHTHYDKGNFIIEAYGETLAADPGMVKYSRPFATQLKGSVFHNVVTVGGRDQSYRDAQRAVDIRSLRSEHGNEWLHADLRNSYRELERYERRIAFVRPDYWLLIDTVDSLEEGLCWNFHSKGEFQVDEPEGDRHLFAARAVAANAALALAVVSDEPLTPAYAEYTDEGEVLSRHLMLRPATSSKRLRLAALLAPYPLDGSTPITIQALRDAETGAAAFEVAGSFGVDRIRCDAETGRATVRRAGSGEGWNLF